MLFTIKDVKSGIFGAPRVAESVEDMKRSIEVISEYDKNSLMSKFPSDFQLFKVGDYDLTSGMIFNQEPEFICRLDEIIVTRNQMSKDYDENFLVIQDKFDELDVSLDKNTVDIVKLNKTIQSLSESLEMLDKRLVNIERRTLWQSMTNLLSCKKY